MSTLRAAPDGLTMLELRTRTGLDRYQLSKLRRKQGLMYVDRWAMQPNPGPSMPTYVAVFCAGGGEDCPHPTRVDA